MSLIDAITDIMAKLRQGRFPNEQAISQGIVLRLLKELNWDTYDTNLVWPEYHTGQGRVDFALCHPASKPAVFIEVKQPCKASEGVVQALQYAFHSGVPFVVLTDGKTWSFYLPAEQGSYEDRRVYKLDLFERDASEAAQTLSNYLDQRRIESGEAIETARKEYRSRNRRAQARAALPDSWRELVEKSDEMLIEIIACAVESKSGIRPDEDDVTSFLANLSITTTTTAIRPQFVPNTLQPRTEQLPSIPASSTRSGTLIFLGIKHSYSTAIEAMLIVLRELAQKDPSFLQRCYQHPDNRGRKRAYIAPTSEELFPGRPDLSVYRESLPDGWFVSTNINNILKKSIMRMATEVAGLNFGSDVIVDF
jgi:predicted type IV restriction endonuclease